MRQAKMGIKLSEEHIENMKICQKGKFVSQETRRKISEARKGITYPHMVGSNHHNWKGGISRENISYRTLHRYIEKELGKPQYCRNCGANEIPEGKKRWFQWANVSGLYKKELSDWIRLCIPCHVAYDSKKLKYSSSKP